jgi:hypothetical protein
VTGFDAGGGRGYVGQQIDARYQNQAPSGVRAMDATDSGKFFLYIGGTVQDPATLAFDVTELSGSPYNPSLRTAATLNWGVVNELQVVQAPGYGNHFLIARGNTAGTPATCIRFDGATCVYWNNSVIRPGKPVVTIAEIDKNSGKALRKKSITLTVPQTEPAVLPSGYSGASTMTPQFVPAFSNIQSAVIGGKTYLFALEDVVGQGEDANVSDWRNYFHEKLVIGVYAFDPAALTLTRKGKITVSDVGQNSFGLISGSAPFQLVASDNGKYPLIAVPSVKYSGQPTFSYQLTINRPSASEEQIQFYGTKNFFASGNAAAQPDLVIRKAPLASIAPAEEVLLTWPFHAITKTENGTTHLYLYRHAFQSTYGNLANADSGLVVPSFDMRNGGGLRIDQVNVTSLVGTSGATTGTVPVISLPPVTPIILPPAPSTTDQCIEKYRNLCDQIKTLQQQLCKLLPTAPLCKP